MEARSPPSLSLICACQSARKMGTSNPAAVRRRTMSVQTIHPMWAVPLGSNPMYALGFWPAAAFWHSARNSSSVTTSLATDLMVRKAVSASTRAPRAADLKRRLKEGEERDVDGVAAGRRVAAGHAESAVGGRRRDVDGHGFPEVDQGPLVRHIADVETEALPPVQAQELAHLAVGEFAVRRVVGHRGVGLERGKLVGVQHPGAQAEAEAEPASRGVPTAGRRIHALHGELGRIERWGAARRCRRARRRGLDWIAGQARRRGRQTRAPAHARGTPRRGTRPAHRGAEAARGLGLPVDAALAAVAIVAAVAQTSGPRGAAATGRRTAGGTGGAAGTGAGTGARTRGGCRGGRACARSAGPVRGNGPARA